MIVLILAAGPDDGWEEEMPKQLVDIDGEPLLVRMLRELEERGQRVTVVTDKLEITDLIPDCFTPDRTDTIFHTILSTGELWDGRVLVLLGDVFYTDKFYDQMLGYEGQTPVCFDSIGLLFDEPDYPQMVKTLFKLGSVAWEDYFNRLWLHGGILKVETGPHVDFDLPAYYEKFLATRPALPPVMVVLAAGDGGRLGQQKPLLEFGGRALVEHILDAWRYEAVVVVGYQQEAIRERLGDRARYVVNEDWADTKTGDSLLAALEHWEGRDCLIVSADHLYGPRMIEYLMARPAGSCVLADENVDLDGEETVLIGDDAGQVERLVFPASTLEEATGLQGECPELFRIAAEDTALMGPHLAGRDVFEAVNQLDNVLWYPVTEPWIEIDTPEDLERAGEVWERIEHREA